MGLDGVELVMAIEECFDIAIRDEEAEKCETVGQIYELIRRKVAEPQSARTSCLTQRAFHRLRRGIMQAGWASRRDIRPDASMDTLIPRRERRANWHALADASSLKLPQLSPVGWLEKFVWLTCLLLVVVAVPVGLFHGVGILLTVLALGIDILLLLVVYKRLGTEILPDRVGEFCEALLLHNAGRLAAGSHKWSDEEIWKLLRLIIVRQLPVREDQVVPDAHFVKDLGLS